MSDITTDVVIIGAGPCGLFQVFELGLLGISAHLVDSLPIAGGQCAELYPEKPIYDIPALPVCGAQELVDRLMKQIEPFKPTFHLGEEVVEFARREDGRFKVGTSAGKVFNAGAVVIAAGVGSFQPRRIGVEGADQVIAIFIGVGPDRVARRVAVAIGIAGHVEPVTRPSFAITGRCK